MASHSAGSIPQAWITDAREITITGRLISTCGIRDQVRIEVIVPRDAAIEAVPRTT